jgi:ankyrin repeat protein
MLVKILMRPASLSRESLDARVKRELLDMIRENPRGTGDSIYLAKPTEKDKPPAAESKIYGMIKEIVHPEPSGLKFETKEEEETVFFTAVSNNKLFTVRKMIQDRPDLIKAVDRQLKTALHYAVNLKNVRIAEALLNLGANIH